MSEVPRAIWAGEFKIFGVTLRCAVLDDGGHTRVINGEDVARLFEVMADPNCPVIGSELQGFSRWQKGLD